MVSAFVLISIDIGSETSVMGNLKNVEGVVEVFMLYRTHAMIAKVKAETLDMLREIVTRSLRSIEKIKSTPTLMVSDEPDFQTNSIGCPQSK